MWWIDFNNIVVDNDKIKILENVMAFGIFDIWWNEIKVERIHILIHYLNISIHSKLWDDISLTSNDFVPESGLGEKHRCFVLEDKLKMDETDKQ